MTVIARAQTIRGLAPNANEIGDDDILEVDGLTWDTPQPSASVTVPPPSGTRYVPTGRYSVVMRRRRRTLRLIGDED